MSERSEVIVWEGDSIAAVFDTTPSGRQDAKDFARELAGRHSMLMEAQQLAGLPPFVRIEEAAMSSEKRRKAQEAVAVALDKVAARSTWRSLEEVCQRLGLDPDEVRRRATERADE